MAVKAKAKEQPYSDLVERAKDDPEAVAQIFALAESEGYTRQLVKANDIAAQAEMSLVRSFSPGDKLVEAMSTKRLALMRKELAGPNPSPLETLLIERIALCWFHVHLVEITLAQRGPEMTITLHDHHQRRLDKAHKRYLAAIKALATVRKLQLPNVQMNFGEKQVNIGSVNGTAAGTSQSLAPA